MRTAQSTFDLDARIREIGAKQLGLLTTQQAMRCGVDKHALARRRDSGALLPVFPRVMRIAPFEQTPRQRALAASLSVPGSVVAATSAALVHQLPIPPGAVPLDEVLSVGANRLVRTAGITAVRQSLALPSMKWFTTRVATPAATLLLLPRFVDDAIVERCLDHCLAHRLTTVDALRRLVDGASPYAIQKRELLRCLLGDRSGGIGHRSRIEQQAARWLTNAGITDWVRNFRVRVGDGTDIEVDFGWPSKRVALEISPFFTHGSRATQERDAKRRRLLVTSGWRVVEAVDDDLENERAFAATVASLRSFVHEVAP